MATSAGKVASFFQRLYEIVEEARTRSLAGRNRPEILELFLLAKSKDQFLKVVYTFHKLHGPEEDEAALKAMRAMQELNFVFTMAELYSILGATESTGSSLYKHTDELIADAMDDPDD